MNPGKLNKRIEFVIKEDLTDDDDFPIEKFISFKKAWASIRGLRGKEFYQASQTQSQDDKIFNCRYFKGLTSDLFIRYKGKVYNIMDVNNLDESNVEYEIHAREIKSSK